MTEAPKYKFRPDLAVSDKEGKPKNTCPIEILEKPFRGIIYRYGEVKFNEVGEELNVNMEIIMVKAPKKFDQQDPAFTQAAGQIFTAILVKDLDLTEQGDDLEADVHEDPIVQEALDNG